MDWVGIVSAAAAGLAAILAGVNLYISDRRDLNKWTRETLIETLTLFLDASFGYASACRNLFRLSPEGREVNSMRRVILAQHDAEANALTRLRILAPPSVVENEVKLLEAEYHLAEPCFVDPASIDVSLETYYALIGPVHENRALFIQAIRASLGLRHISGTGTIESNVRWSKLRNALSAAEMEAGTGEQEHLTQVTQAGD